MMEIDIRTLIIILGFTYLMQMLVFFQQYKANKTYNGINWWLLWSAAEVIGFGAMLFRGIPSILSLVIIVQNFMIVAGTVFLYIGIREFTGKKANFKLILPILSLFVIGVLYFLFIDNNIQIRSAIINATFAIISFITAYSLIFERHRSVSATANFNAAIFIVHGCIFFYRTIIIIGGAPLENIFAPSLFNILPYFDALIVSLLWTFGLIIMVNQRLHAEVLESKEELQIIFNTSPDAAIITRLEDGLIVNFNEGYLAISGYNREEMAGKSTPEINIWKNLDDRNKVVSLLKEKGVCENYEAEFLLKNGTTITGLLSAKIIMIQEVPHIISITRNITERKQMEAKMHESEKSFRLLFENMTEGVAMHEMIYNKEGQPIDYRIIEVNSSFEKHTGISAQIAKGKLATELYGVKNPPYLSEYNKVVLTRKPFSFETHFAKLNKDFSISAICTKSGCFATIFMDITESKIKEHETFNLLESTEKSRDALLSILEDQMQAHQLLQESEARFRSTFDQSPIGAVIVGLDKHFIRCNATFSNYLGYTESELIGKSISDVTYPEDIDIGMKELKLLVEGKIETAKLIKRYLRKDGSMFWGEITMYLVRDDNNKPLYFLPIIQDITERLQAETNIKESEEKFRSFFEYSMVGKSMTTIDGKLRTNKAFNQILGYSEEELKNLKWQQITHPDDIEQDQKIINSIVSGDKTSARWEKRYIHKNGNIVWVDISTTLQRDKEGNPLYFITGIIDITERKLAEEEIIQNENRLKLLVNILQYQTDTVQEYLDYALTMALELTQSKIGYIYHYNEEKKEFILNTWSEGVMKECTITDQQTIYQLEKTGIWGEAVRQRKPILVNNFQAAHPLKKGYPEGHAMLYKFLTVPVFSNKQIVGVVGVANKESNYTEIDTIQLSLLMDVVWKVVERIKAEEEFRKIYNRQSAILSAVHDIIVEVNNYKIYTWANAAAYNFFGEDIIGKEANYYFIGRQEVYELVNPLFSGDENVIYIENWQRRKDGESRLLAWWCKTLKNENGMVVGALSSARDITEYRKQEEEIQNLNASLEQKVKIRTAQLETAYSEMEAFSYSVSHDLRSPLRAINGFAKILAENNQQLDVESKRLLGIINQNANNMGQLIDDLLTFAKVGKANISQNPINMREIVKSIVQQYRKEAMKKNIAINIAKLPAVSGDPVLINQVWNNLIKNAIKFSSKTDNPEVNIGGYVDGNEVIYFIKDNGVGFDIKYKDKLFKVFERLHTSEEFEGTGIGLAIVKKAIGKHGGRVWADSVLGQGASFYFSLPK